MIFDKKCKKKDSNNHITQKAVPENRAAFLRDMAGVTGMYLALAVLILCIIILFLLQIFCPCMIFILMKWEKS